MYFFRRHYECNADVSCVLLWRFVVFNLRFMWYEKDNSRFAALEETVK